MKEFLKNLWMDYVLAAVITVLAGLLITVFYQVAMDVVCVLLGISACSDILKRQQAANILC